MRALSIVLVALVAATGSAEPKKPGKGFWKVLVKKGAKWKLHDKVSEAGKPATLTIETYDVRKVGNADVARLRWTLDDGTAHAIEPAAPLSQVAVTDAGIYLLWASMDDAKVAAALEKKPSRSDPPKAYEGTKLNEGRYLHIRDGLVCMGQGPTPDAGDCPDTCDGWVCISATKGIVEVSGTWAPGTTIFESN